MTSKISFSKMVRSELHQMNWLTAIWALLFGLLIPFRVLLVMALQAAPGREGWSDTPFEIFCRQVGLGHPENTVFILLAGAVCALCAFSYLHSAVKLDLYHSLALRREGLFAARYLGSVLTFVIAYLASQVLAALIGVFYGAVTPRLLFELALASIQGILHFLCSYSTVLVAIMLTGKILTTVFAVGVFGTYIPILYVLLVAYLAVFFETSLSGFSFDVAGSKILKCSSPWAFCLFQPLQGKTIGVTGYVPTMGELCQLLALAVILTMLALLLYRMRKTETAGSALAFRRTEGAIKLLLAVPTALWAALAANELFESVLWEIVFILLFGTLACMIMEFIYRWDIRQVLQQKKYIAATAVLAGVLFFPFRFDVMGYNTYIPAKEDVAAMSVRDVHYNIRYPEVTGSYLYSYGDDRKLLDYFETEDFEPLYKMAQNGVAHAGEGHGGVCVCVYVKYRTTNGRELYRAYFVDAELYLDTMDEMMQNPEFKEKYFPILKWGEEEAATLTAYAAVNTADIAWDESDISNAPKGEKDPDEEEWEEDMDEEEWAEDMDEEEYWDEDVEYADDASSFTHIDIPSSKLKSVIEAYCRDLEDVTYRDIWLSDSYLHFMKDQVSSDSDLYPLSDAFTHTLEALKEIQKE